MTKLQFLQQIKTQRDESLWDLSFRQPVLVVFLRHFGCVFCREALAELGSLKDKIRESHTHLVLAHLADAAVAESFFQANELDNVDYITDPEARVYQQFGLMKGEMQQMMGLKVWLRTFDQGVIKGRGIRTRLIGDGFQMPGVFLLFEGEIRDQFIHASIADKPDYLKLATCLECGPS